MNLNLPEFWRWCILCYAPGNVYLCLWKKMFLGTQAVNCVLERMEAWLLSLVGFANRDKYKKVSRIYGNLEYIVTYAVKLCIN